MMKSLLRKVRSAAESDAVAEFPDYDELYEQHARENSDDEAVGNGDFDIIGQIELSIARWAGLNADTRLLDFGCGTGRLAVHVIPALTRGHYVGVDISPTMLERAQKRCRERGLGGKSAEWRVETNAGFGNLSGVVVDLGVAFSVFTHMDSEDALLYLQALRRVVRPGGRLVVSNLLLDESKEAQNVLVMSSTIPYRERRRRVLSITTSRSHFDTVATLAGWTVLEWVRHDDERWAYGPDGALMGALGQAICLLENPA